jgi:transcription elongation factor Elf1
MTWNQQRQASRGKDGKYKTLPSCPRCGKRRCVEHCYNDKSKWNGLFICAHCVRQESR